MGNNKNNDDGHGVAIAGGFFRVVLYICILFFIIYLGKTAFSFGYSIVNQQAVDKGTGKDVTVVIKDKTSVYKMGKILENKGLIKDAKVFVVQEKLSNYKNKLKAGTYILNTSMVPDELMAVISQEVTEGQPVQPENKNQEEEQKTNDSEVYDKVSQDAGDSAEGTTGSDAETPGE